MDMQITPVGKLPRLRNPLLIEGLPGIGNVGKVAVDFLIEELKAKKVYEIFSFSFPNSVFVNEQNLVDLPVVELYYCETRRRSILLLAGDIQPTEEKASYEFSDEVLRLVERCGTKEIITLGGIGLPAVPKEPKVYITGNSKEMIRRYKADTRLDDRLFGVVGPIIGVTGLLLGLAQKRKIDAVALLAETYGHPMYLGVKGAREILAVLNKKLELGIDISKIEREISNMDKEESSKKKRLQDISKQSAISNPKKFPSETSYIG